MFDRARRAVRGHTAEVGGRVVPIVVVLVAVAAAAYAIGASRNDAPALERVVIAGGTDVEVDHCRRPRA